MNRYDSPTETYKRKLRITEAVERSLVAQLPLLGELVDHASVDLAKFALLQPDQPPALAEAYGAAKTAIEGLALVLEMYNPEPPTDRPV